MGNVYLMPKSIGAHMRLDESERFRHGEMRLSQRIGWLDALRGFAMLCVIMGASFRHGSAGENMAVFVSHAFVLYYSGALFRYEKYDSILACVKDQAKKLLFPYAMLTIVCAPFWYINLLCLETAKYHSSVCLLDF